MKIRLLIFILLAFSVSKSVFAQDDYELFTAKEGLEFLSAEMPEGTQLFAIMTSMAPDSPMPLDLNTGKAALWIYLFKSVESPTQGLLIILFKFDSAFFMLPGEEIDELPEDLQSIESNNWINSDAMISELKKNNSFSSYLESNPEILSVQIILSYAASSLSEEMPIPPQFMDKLIWIASINEDFHCFIDALTGETFCISAPSEVVETKLNNNLKAYPQPASDLLEITLPENSSCNKVEIYNIFGQLISDFTPTANNNVISINTTGLNTGTYIVKMYDGKTVNTQKISIIK